MAQGREPTRRTGQERTGGRAEGVVERVNAATLAELSRVGYQAMRVEDIAALSGVNKTTIYRRWPSKAELLESAMSAAASQHLPPIDTGTLRGDLRASLLTAFNLRPFEQGVLRAVQMERANEAIDGFARRMREELREKRILMVQRGVARGELPQAVDAALVVDLISAPVQLALLFNERMNAALVERVLDIVLTGAAAVTTRSTTTRRLTSRSAAVKPSHRSRRPRSSRS